MELAYHDQSVEGILLGKGGADKVKVYPPPVGGTTYSVFPLLVVVLIITC